MRGPLEPLEFDVGDLVRKSLASLYSHLVTRPTGRAVRLAIESRLAEAGEPSLSLVDFSQVTILDFSCADEVVARLLRRYGADDRPRDAFFLFRGVQEWHEEPIQAVLERQGLAAVAQIGTGERRLMGTVSEAEARSWRAVERRGVVHPSRGLPDDGGVGPLDLEHLAMRRLVFPGPRGGFHALGRLAESV